MNELTSKVTKNFNRSKSPCDYFPVVRLFPLYCVSFIFFLFLSFSFSFFPWDVGRSSRSSSLFDDVLEFQKFCVDSLFLGGTCEGMPRDRLTENGSDAECDFS